MKSWIIIHFRKNVVFSEGQNSKPTSYTEYLKAMRDYKRRRQSYRAKNVHITRKSYTEVTLLLYIQIFFIIQSCILYTQLYMHNNVLPLLLFEILKKFNITWTKVKKTYTVLKSSNKTRAYWAPQFYKKSVDDCWQTLRYLSWRLFKGGFACCL